MTKLLSGLSNGCYLAGHFLEYALMPRCYYRMQRESILDSLTTTEREELEQRVGYYNQIQKPTPIENGTTVGQYKFPYRQKRRFTTYFFDFYEVVRYFNPHSSFHFIPGDVVQVPDVPTFVKSRPIRGNNANAVLLKLNKRRHFTDRKSVV